MIQETYHDGMQVAVEVASVVAGCDVWVVAGVPDYQRSTARAAGDWTTFGTVWPHGDGWAGGAEHLADEILEEVRAEALEAWEDSLASTDGDLTCARCDHDTTEDLIRHLDEGGPSQCSRCGLELPEPGEAWRSANGYE